MPILSICIPTYNRGSELNVLLTSLYKNICADVEIVISDNCSSDNTVDILNYWCKKFDAFKFCINKKNIGYDLNMINVVSMASGDYCWTIGSDDAVNDHAIEYVLMLCKKNKPSGISVSYKRCDDKLNIVDEVNWVDTNGKEFIQLDRDDALRYIGAYYGFISAQIFKKTSWDKIISDKKHINFLDGWIHYYMNLRMSYEHNVSGWLYCSKPLILYRSSSFKDQVQHFGGVGKRLLHDIREASKAYFSALPMDVADRFVLKNLKCLRGDILQWKLSKPTVLETIKIYLMTCKYYKKYTYYWLSIVPVIIIPKCLAVCIKKYR